MAPLLHRAAIISGSGVHVRVVIRSPICSLHNIETAVKAVVLEFKG